MALTRGEVNRTLRSFTVASGLWGAWGQMVGMGTAIFTGFVLSVGADAADIAFYTAIAYLVAPVQILVSLFNRWIHHKKRWVIVNGFFEALFRCLLVAIPFLFVESLHKKVLLIFLTLGLIAGYLYSPFYNSWMASTVPSNIRARFTSRQTIVSTLFGMVAAIVSGWFVDWYPGGQSDAFILVFIGGTLFGWAGHFIISRAEYPQQTEAASGQNRVQHLIQPFRDRNFRRLILFYASWNFAIGLSGPLFSVFMLERLHFSYTSISLLNALGMLATILGYRIWSGLIDRFGGKPVLQILIIPGALNAVFWGLCQPGAFVMVAIAMATSGIIMSGISVAVTPLLYALLPEANQDEKVSYLASWSTSVNMIYALGPMLGGILVASLSSVQYSFAGLIIGDIHILFFVSALMRFVPYFLLRSVEETRAISSTELLSTMFRGNLLSYAFHNVMFNLATAEESRARATFALGRSRNPLALAHLVEALSDASPSVRSQAARALGESGSEKAVESLIDVLVDDASDIRSEAAEALGKLQHPRALDPLYEALDDPDPRVKMSAIRGLADFGGDDVREALFWHFSNTFDPRTFPTLVDALSQHGDQRIIKPTFARLEEFPSPAIRLQLINSVCQALGANGEFYRFLSMEEHKRYEELESLLKNTTAVLTESSALPEDTRHSIEIILSAFRQAHEQNDIPTMMEQGRLLAALIRDSMLPQEKSPFDTLAVYVIIMAMNHFISHKAHQDLLAAQEIFLTVCLNRIAEILER